MAKEFLAAGGTAFQGLQIPGRVGPRQNRFRTFFELHRKVIGADRDGQHGSRSRLSFSHPSSGSSKSDGICGRGKHRRRVICPQFDMRASANPSDSKTFIVIAVAGGWHSRNRAKP